MSSLFSLIVLFCYVVSFTSAGFSTSLYQRDHVSDRTLSKMERLSRGIDRDLKRLARANRSLDINLDTPITNLKEVGGTYMIKLALGTPPNVFFAAADTGSEVTWVQCYPCHKCYPQNSEIFDPAQTAGSYQIVKCISDHHQFPCPAFDGVSCIDNICTSRVLYGDGSFSKGVLSTDNMIIQSTADQPIVVDHYIFQCGTYNQGDFSPEQAGIIGLGRGQRSLITQLDKYINGRFSYCLFPDIQGGKMHFGDDAVVQGPGVVTTPIFQGEGANYASYLATLQGLTIGDERLNFHNNPGNIIIDSGATLTQFPQKIYQQIVASVRKQITAKPVQDPSKRLKVCFDEPSFKFIPMTAHFTSADVVLNEYNMFQKVAPRVICLTVTQGRYTIWGNTAQLDFLVGFDVAAGTVSFKSTEC